MRRVERCFLALGVVSLCCGSVIAAQRPDFSGDWQIDLEASDGVAGEIARRSQDSLRENTRDDIVDLQAQGEAFGGERTSNRQPRNDDEPDPTQLPESAADIAFRDTFGPVVDPDGGCRISPSSEDL